jgi:DNA-binding response OmpR family regulator
MDLQMPGLNGIEAVIAIRSEFSNARIIVLTTYAGDVQVLRALKAGALAYVLKGHVHRELLDTIRAGNAGKKRIPPEVAAELAVRTNQTCCAHGFCRPDPGGNRDGKRIDCSGNSQSEFSTGCTVHKNELRRDPRRSAGERTLRA